MWRIIIAAIVAVWATGCESQPPPAARDVLTWRPIGTWSGRGNLQTESFGFDTGSLRVSWRTQTILPAERGVFRLGLHSSVSGRMLTQIVEQTGPGDGVREVNEDPRAFYLVVESTSLDWTVTVEEGVLGKVEPTEGR